MESLEAFKVLGHSASVKVFRENLSTEAGDFLNLNNTEAGDIRLSQG